MEVDQEVCKKCYKVVSSFIEVPSKKLATKLETNTNAGQELRGEYRTAEQVRDGAEHPWPVAETGHEESCGGQGGESHGQLRWIQGGWDKGDEER